MAVIDEYLIFGGFNLTDGDFRTLKGKSYPSREAAEKARTKAIAFGCRFIQ